MSSEVTSCIPPRPRPVPVTTAGAAAAFLQDTAVIPARSASCTSGRKLPLLLAYSVLHFFRSNEKKSLISRKVSYRYVAAFVFSLSVMKNALFYAVEKVFRLEKMFRSTWGGGGLSRIPNFPCLEIGFKKQKKILSHHRRRNNDCEASPIWIPGHPLHTYTDTERLRDNFFFFSV